MKLIIAGSRDIYDYETVKQLIDEAIKLNGWNVTEVVSGNCPTGVDSHGEKWATENGCLLSLFPAEWGKYGNVAGVIRNVEMAQYGDALLLIHNGSRGSSRMYDAMYFIGKEIHQVAINSDLFV